MKDLTGTGHKYELQSFENGKPQVLQFIEKAHIADGSIELRTVNDGTTNEEVLKMLIDRATKLNQKFASREGSLAITKMEEALMWFNKRTENRIVRNVEGKHTN